jgi:hypothetical protein
MQKKRILARGLAVMAVLPIAGVLSTTPAFACTTSDPAQCVPADTTLIWPDASDPDGNTGDNNAPLAEDILVSVPNASLTQAKLEAVSLMRPYTVALIGGASPELLRTQCELVNTATECGDRVPPNSASVPGNVLYAQTTSYTCAPTSARSILRSMTGVDRGESNLAHEMKTNSSRGTTWSNISPVMNRYQSNDYFVGEPEYGGLTPDEVMNRVVFDVSQGGSKQHSAILNVDQSQLKYWNRSKSGRHYLTASAYNISGKSITLGDVAGSHYGYHTVSLTEATTAIVANKGLVIY